MSIIAKYFTNGTTMQKDELLALVTNMHKELLANINTQESATKEQVFNYLVEAAYIIKNADENQFTNNNYAESLFHNAYKEIAQKSLESYSKTNANIEKLVSMHEETISSCEEDHIDLPAITEKFDEIQQHMTDEVTKANAVISALTQQVKDLEEQTNLDALTKVYNRHALINYLNKLCSKKELPYTFHLLLLDIDDFKLINDTYGHLAGDKVLIYMSNILKKTLRDGDKIFRYGGEEFVIILNRVGNEQCRRITSRIRALIEENQLIYKGQKLKLTASIGTTRYKPGDTPDTLIARADKALYRAKTTGKNKIETEL